MTLIEVIVALTILSSLVAAALVARGQHLRQWAAAQHHLVAIAAADDLLTQWWNKPNNIPANGEGLVPGHPELRWRISTGLLPQFGGVKTRLLRLEILDADTSVPTPITNVEVILPDETGLHTD